MSLLGKPGLVGDALRAARHPSPAGLAIALNLLVVLAVCLGLWAYGSHLRQGAQQAQRERMAQMLDDQAQYTSQMLGVHRHVVNQLRTRLQTLGILGGTETEQDLLRRFQYLLPDVVDVWLTRTDGTTLNAATLNERGTRLLDRCLSAPVQRALLSTSGFHHYAGAADVTCPPAGSFVLVSHLASDHGPDQRLWWWLDRNVFDWRLQLNLGQLGFPVGYDIWSSERRAALMAVDPGAAGNLQRFCLEPGSAPPPDGGECQRVPVAGTGLELRVAYLRTDMSRERVPNDWWVAAFSGGLLVLAWTGFTVAAVRTTRRHSQEVASNETRYRRSLEYAACGAWEWDVATGAIHWTPQVGPMFGFDQPVERIDWEGFMARVHPTDRQRVEKAINDVLTPKDGSAKGTYHVVHRVLWPDGQVRTLRETGNLERAADGSPHKMYGVVQDITQWRARDLRLTMLSHAVESLEEVVLLVEAPPNARQRPRVLFHNAAFSRLTGFEGVDLTGQPMPDLRASREGMSYGQMVERLQQGLVVHAELPFRQRGGDIFWLDMNIQPIHDEDGSLPQWLLVARDVTARREHTQTLARSERRYRALFEGNPNPMGLVDPTTRKVIAANAAAARQYGYSLSEFEGMPLGQLEAPGRTVAPAPHRAGVDRQFEQVHQRKDGTRFDAAVSTSDLDFEGHTWRLVLVHDVTDRNRARRAADDAARRTQAILDNVVDAIITMGSDGRVRTFNDAAVRMFGHPAEDVIGEKVNTLMPSSHAAAHDGYMSNYEQTGERRIIGKGRELKALHRSGREFPIHLTVTEILQDGERVYIGVVRDHTEREAAQERIQRLAYYDELTDLPNRRLLLERLEHATLQANHRQQWGALVLIDMDQFKIVNDSVGQKAGDEVLRQVALRLQDIARKGDTVARMTADEFAVLIDPLGTSAEAVAADVSEWVTVLLERLREDVLVNLPGRADPLRLQLSASAGVTLVGGQHASGSVVLGEADVAMHQAKVNGRNTCCFFDDGLQALAHMKAELIADMRSGLERGDFHLVFQPQMNDRDQVVGAEALLRWKHPVRGAIPPAEFIPLAEHSGLMLDMGAWVLRQAAQHLARWSAQPALAALPLAVNVSALQFRAPGFVNLVVDVLAATGIKPALLKLELTESVLADDTARLLETMRTLRRHGVSFSLDDFGTGYSSLSYLRQLPLSEIKIDKSFVRDVMTNTNDAAITRTIIALAETLDLGVLAEGVETRGQRDFLESAGCRLYQGYYFSRPLDEAALLQFVEGAAGQYKPMSAAE